jgi:plastocyanin
MRRFVWVGCVMVVVVMSARATTWQVTVQDFQFTPATLTINQGDTVVWTNVQGTHSVFHACGTSLFGNSVAVAPWVYQFAFDVPPGMYPYECQVHPDLMLGSITVLRVPQRWDVNVQNYAFTPANITVQQGDTIVWTNTFGFHSVHHTGTPTKFGTPSAGAVWTYTFPCSLSVGTYPYICEVHPTLMQGTVTVTAPPAPPAAPNALVVHVSGDNATLRWNAVSGATCYTENGADVVLGQLIGITGDSTFVQPVSALPGSKYFFQVRAVGQ